MTPSEAAASPATPVIDRKAVHSALKAWHYPHKLGTHALARLCLVSAQHSAARHPDTPIGYGLALREVLRTTIETLKPDGDAPDLSDPAWRHYLLLARRYVHGRPVTEVAEGLGMAYSTFQHEQALAMDLLANALLAREQESGPAAPGETEPAARAVREAPMPRQNLPTPLSSFIGRQGEIAKLMGWLTPPQATGARTLGHDAGGKVRLVTLTGVGGTGKSRLALEAAWACLPAYPQGAWLVELAPLADPQLLPETVVAALDVPRDPDRPVLRALTDYLREKTLLLLFDNCEHMLDACASLAEHLLCECPQLRILATSREALGVAGETTLHVRSLAVPAAPSPGSGALDLAALAECEAVQLFVDRASAVRPEFEVTEANAPFLAQICRRLDGIPLAMELAAARIRALSVEQIAARLDDRFRLLTGGSRTALPRHQTLRATLDWSYDLLAAPERTLLARFSVFAGGWTLEAAEGVGGDLDTMPPAEVLDGLTRLVDKSLVIAEEQGGETRYRMLETIRQYARDKLHDSGEVEAVRGRHLEYYLQFTLAAAAEFHGPGQLAALERLDRELDNLRAALEWSLGPGRVERGLRLVEALPWFWEHKRADPNEGLAWAERLLAQPEAEARNLARAGGLLVVGYLSDKELRRAHLEEAVSIAREQAEAGRWLLARGLGELGSITFGNDPGGGEAILAEGVALARSLGDAWLLARSLNLQGRLLAGRGDYCAARQALEEGLALCQAIEDQYETAWLQRALASVNCRQGDCAAAIQLGEQVVLFYRAVKDPLNLATALWGLLCDLERFNGRYDAAKAHSLEALGILQDLGIPAAPGLLGNLGFIALHEGDLDTAKRLFAESLAAARESGRSAILAFQGVARGAVLAMENRAREAVVLMAFSHTFFKSGDQRILTPADWADYEHYLALARAQLDEAGFQAAWAEGCAMSLEQALAYAEREAA